MVDHSGTILLESFVFSHPDNIIDYVSKRPSGSPPPCTREGELTETT